MAAKYTYDRAIKAVFSGRGVRRTQGFSLVEIVIAIAVISSSFLVIFGLLGVGLNTFHQSKAISVSSQIAQQVYSQLENAPFANVVSSASSTAGTASGRASAVTTPPAANFYNGFTNGASSVTTLYFDEQGNELASATGAIYWVNVCILYPTPLPPYTEANPPSSTSGTTFLNVDLATVLVQVAYDPAGKPPAADLINSKKWAVGNGAMQIANYQFYVTRNS